MPTDYGARVTPARGQDSYAVNFTPTPNNDHRQSGIGAVGLGFLSGDMDDDGEDDDDDFNFGQPSPAKPHLKQDELRKDPGLSQSPPPAYGNLRIATNPSQPIPRPPKAAYIHPPPSPLRADSMSPHPLLPPKTPIAPVFARPKLEKGPSEVKFSADSILRGNTEETLLSRSTPKGDEFWRRFSFVIHEEKPGSRSKSTWLSKNQARRSRMNICVWLITIALLCIIGGIATAAWFFTRNSPASTPKVIGGSNAGLTFNSTSTAVMSQSSVSSSSPIRTITGDLAPTTTPPVPAGFNLPTTTGVIGAKRTIDPSIAKDTFAAHRRGVRMQNLR